MGRLCVFGRWEPVPGPAGGLFGPSGREQERAERGRNRPRGGAGEGKLAEVWSEGWWRAAGRCAEGVASRRRGGGSWRRGVAGEHAARGHCLTGIEPLRGSTTSFSVTSGARSPAAFRPRWPLSAPLIASAPVPAPALVPRPSAPLASLRSFNRFRSYSRPGARPPAFRPRWPVSAPVPAPGTTRSRSRLLSPLHSGRPLLPYLRKKNSGPPKRGVRS